MEGNGPRLRFRWGTPSVRAPLFLARKYLQAGDCLGEREHISTTPIMSEMMGPDKVAQNCRSKTASGCSSTSPSTHLSPPWRSDYCFERQIENLGRHLKSQLIGASTSSTSGEYSPALP